MLTDHLGDELGSEIIFPQRILDVAANGAVKALPENVGSSHQNFIPPTKANQKFEECGFCLAGVLDGLMSRHLLGHIQSGSTLSTVMLPPIRSDSSSNETRKRIYLPANSSGSSIGTKEPYKLPPIEDLRTFFKAREKILEVPDPKLKPIERFQFREIHDISWASATSSSTRYSDFLLIIWMKERPYFHSTNYTGGHHGTVYKSNDHLNIHLAYDHLEKFYTISSKLFKRNTYSHFDSEESIAPDRICEQHELLTQLRRILLFYQVPPRAVMKRFLSVSRQGVVLFQDKDNKNVPLCYSVNYNKLFEDYKKVGQKAPIQDDEYGHGYFCGGE